MTPFEWQIFAVLLSIVTVSGGHTSALPQIDKLVVLDPFPVINIQNRDILRISCYATGNPKPTYTWKRNGKILREKGDYNRIQIKNGELKIVDLYHHKDNGNYQCLATNVHGTVLRELKVQIFALGQFLPPNRVHADRKAVDVVLGKRAIVRCPAHSYAYPKIYIWGAAANDKKIYPVKETRRHFVTQRGDLVYAYVTRLDVMNFNYGYNCFIYNSGQYDSSRKYFLNVIGNDNSAFAPKMEAYMKKEEIGIEGNSKSLKCGATGKPTPNITWYKDSVEVKKTKNNALHFKNYVLQNDGTKLVIKKTHQQDAGIFKCVATNSMGQDWKEGRLSVQSKPRWVTRPKSVQLSISGSHSLLCSAIGEPKVKYEWYRNGELLTTAGSFEVNGNILRIHNAQLSDSSLITCLARNPHGSIATSSSLKIVKV